MYRYIVKLPFLFFCLPVLGTDLDSLVELTRTCGMRFLFEFNLQLRYGDQWDPHNAEQILDHLTSKGYGDNIDFELGNGNYIYQ